MRDSETRWPIHLWALQSVPGIALTAFGLWGAGDESPLSPSKSYLLATAACAWVIVTIAMVVMERGRRFLIANRWQLTLAAVSMLTAIVAFDLVLTASGTVPTIAQQRSSSLSHSRGTYTSTRLVPQDIAGDGYAIYINRRGLRGPEIDQTPPPGRKRLLLLGGSQVMDFANNWPGKLEQILRTKGVDVEVLNAGVAGHNSADSLTKLALDLWTLKPDIVFVCHAWNDAKYVARLAVDEPFRGLPPERPTPWYPDWRLYPVGVDSVLSHSAIYRNFRWAFITKVYPPEEFDTRLKLNAGLSGTSHAVGLAQFRQNLALIAETTKLIGAQLVLCKQARLAVSGADGDAQAMAREYGTRVTGLSDEALFKILDGCDEVIEETAGARGAVIVDMDHGLSGNEQYFADGIHFSEAGADAAAELVAQALEPLLTTSSSP